MEFDIKQKNNLMTGVRMVAELKPSTSELRKFIIVNAYDYDENQKRIELTKFIKNDMENKINFELRCYEIPKEFYDNGWEMDIEEKFLVNDVQISDIKGFNQLNEKLQMFIDDFSIFKPDWDSDNFI